MKHTITYTGPGDRVITHNDFQKVGIKDAENLEWRRNRNRKNASIKTDSDDVAEFLGKDPRFRVRSRQETPPTQPPEQMTTDGV